MPSPDSFNPFPLNAALWPAVCRLKIAFPASPDGSRVTWVGGSGCLIGPRLVLTAGHNVYNFVPALGRSTFALGGVAIFPGPREVAIERGETNDQWAGEAGGRLSFASQYDVGVFSLQERLPFEVFRPKFVADDDRLRTGGVNVVGYPIVPPLGPNGQQYLYGTLFGGLTEVEVGPGRFAYPMRMMEGVSGGPVYIKDGTTRVVCGVHNSRFVEPPGPERYGGVRIHADVKSLIDQWMTAYP
ncbi:MAG TPA: trypsin-like peptidase domain-containing protein [Planctomycetaceae bacterium]